MPSSLLGATLFKEGNERHDLNALWSRRRILRIIVCGVGRRILRIIARVVGKRIIARLVGKRTRIIARGVGVGNRSDRQLFAPNGTVRDGRGDDGVIDGHSLGWRRLFFIGFGGSRRREVESL
jgi:hypothetical protein